MAPQVPTLTVKKKLLLPLVSTCTLHYQVVRERERTGQMDESEGKLSKTLNLAPALISSVTL